MIVNLQPGTINIGVGIFPSLMGTFDYRPPSNDVKFSLAVLSQPKAVVF
jgi:hypothetical protein